MASCGASRGSGPVVFQGADVRNYSGGYTTAGTQMLFGTAIVENNGSKTAMLMDASLVGDVSADQAEVDEVRVMLLRPGRTDLIVGPWPDEYYKQNSVPLKGFQLEPGDEAAVLYIISVHETGVWNWPTMSLKYRAGRWTHTTTALTGFQVCPPDDQECPEMELP